MNVLWLRVWRANLLPSKCWQVKLKMFHAIWRHLYTSLVLVLWLGWQGERKVTKSSCWLPPHLPPPSPSLSPSLLSSPTSILPSFPAIPLSFFPPPSRVTEYPPWAKPLICAVNSTLYIQWKASSSCLHKALSSEENKEVNQQHKGMSLVPGGSGIYAMPGRRSKSCPGGEGGGGKEVISAQGTTLKA